VIGFGEFTLEVDRYLLRKEDKIVTITLSEFGILKRLLTNRGKVLTRNQLLDDVHNDDAFIVDRNIDVHIASLRKNWAQNLIGLKQCEV
jgi:two-component system alkaline phosphatase synthesis response regulator PhoP